MMIIIIKANLNFNIQNTEIIGLNLNNLQDNDFWFTNMNVGSLFLLKWNQIHLFIHSIS